MSLVEKFYGKSESYFDEKACAFTAREIAHQPDMWRDLCVGLQNDRQRIADFFAAMGDLSKLRVIMTGAGSSGFVGAAVSGYLAECNGIQSEAIHTTDIVSAPKAYLFDVPTLLISFARSGNSPESEGAVLAVRKFVKNLYEIAIVCDGESKLSKAAKASDKSLVLVMPEGTNDKGFAMTSSVSSMILAGFAMFNICKLDEIAADINRLADYIEENGTKLSAAAEEVAKLTATGEVERIWYLGSGPLRAIANEGALKVMELTNGRVVTGFNSATEFRHGPKTVINQKTATVHFISGNGFTAKYDMDLLKELYQQRDGNKVIAIHNHSLPAKADLVIQFCTEGYGICKDAAAGIQGLVAMQLISMQTSLALGLTTDNPSPSGLVNRVVQGVTVYPC